MTKHSVRLPRKRQSIPLLVTLLALTGVAVVFAATAPPNIDFFAESQGQIVVNGGGPDTATPEVMEATPGNILGRYRDIYAKNVTGAPSGRMTLEVVGGTPGTYNHSLDVGVLGNSVITYDGSGGGYPFTSTSGL